MESFEKSLIVLKVLKTSTFCRGRQQVLVSHSKDVLQIFTDISLTVFLKHMKDFCAETFMNAMGHFYFNYIHRDINSRSKE